MTHTRIAPIHPGEVLLEVYMKSSTPSMTVAGLSQRIQVSRRYIQDLIDGNRHITHAIAVRLGMISCTTPQYWLDLQKMYDDELPKRGMIRAQRQRRKQISKTMAA